MAEYISTFTTGFKSAVESQITKDLTNVKIIAAYDGLIHYEFAGQHHEINRLVYFNNTFYILKCFKNGETFGKMVNAVCKGRHSFIINEGTFRVRFSKENQFAKVDKGVTSLAEKHVTKNSKLLLDRLNPTTEIWYIIRSENVGYCGQLISKRAATEKNLNKGELRPEFAYLMCCCTDITQESVVCDPFCGTGAIPKQLVRSFQPKTVLASDRDNEKIEQLENELGAETHGLQLFIADALCLKEIEDSSVDIIITDPPWGFFEEIADISEFYVLMLREMKRVLRESGKVVLLSARKEEFTKALSSLGVLSFEKIDTLVNGKKAAVFTFGF